MPEPGRAPVLLLSCEHGGRRVPRRYGALFGSARARHALDSHRGWDPGALDVARALARALEAPLLFATTSRLLVDANRSPHNPAVFSAWTRHLCPADRAELLERHHRPHWERVRVALAERIGAKRSVLHVAVHSFTPVLCGKRRNFEVGLLYDPARLGERRLARRWQQRLRAQQPGLRVRRNAPYRGNADGLTSALRRELPAHRYLGLELELNQLTLAAPRRRVLVRAIAATLGAELPHG